MNEKENSLEGQFDDYLLDQLQTYEAQSKDEEIELSLEYRQLDSF